MSSSMIERRQSTRSRVIYGGVVGWPGLQGYRQGDADAARLGASIAGRQI